MTPFKLRIKANSGDDFCQCDLLHWDDDRKRYGMLATLAGMTVIEATCLARIHGWTIEDK